MEIINEGLFYSCEQLLFYLEELFHLKDNGINLEHEISYLKNHEGYWTIGFKSVPGRGLLLAIIALFETRMAEDGIGEVIFYYGHPRAVEIKYVAGCYWQDSEAMCKALEVQSELYPVRRLEEADKHH